MDPLDAIQRVYNHNTQNDTSNQLFTDIQHVLDILLACQPHQTQSHAPTKLTKEQWRGAFSWVFAYCELSAGAQNCRDLYQYVRDRLTSYVDELFYLIANPTPEMTDQVEFMLKYYCDSWKAYHKALRDVDNVLSHLNRSFVKGLFSDQDALHVYEAETCINDCLISIKDMGLYLWKSKLTEHSRTMFNTTCACIVQLRATHDPDRISMLKELQDSLELLDDSLTRRFLDHKYQTILDDIFIRATDVTAAEQYNVWGQELATQTEWTIVMETLLSRLDDEQLIFEVNFIPLVWNKLSKLFFHQLVQPVAPTLQTHALSCIQSGDVKQLHGLFRLLLPLNQCEPIYQGMVQTYLKQIQNKLDAIGSTPSELKEKFFQALDESYTAIESFIAKNFSVYSNELFRCMDSAFTLAINAWRPPTETGSPNSRGSLNRSIPNPSDRNMPLSSFSSSTLLVKYIHNYLKHPCLTVDLMRHLERAVKFVSYLQEKDCFMRYYVIQFNRRLLENFPASEEVESLMLRRLHPIIASTCEIGSGRPARMLKDYAATEILNRNFCHSLMHVVGEMRDLEKETSLEAVKSCNFNVCLVTSWAWSLRLDRSVVVPPNQYAIILREFTRYYQSVYKHRRIQWMHSYGMVEVLFHKRSSSGASSSQYDESILLKLQPCSAYLLEYFDNLTTDGRQVSATQLKSLFTNNASDSSVLQPSSGVSSLTVSDDDRLNGQEDVNEGPDKTFASALEPLHKCGLFILENDVIRINEDFTCQNKVIDLHVSYFNCPEPKMKRSEQVTLLADRRLFLECCIMRIMKHQSQVAHDALLQQVQEKAKSRFQPTVRDIKDVIGSLIERGFLQRSSNNMDLYEYCK